ncbi:MAG: histidinol-phosphatase HisJ family protein [Lachnospiraceae bacterium]|jgi:histidinol-phosphatase (PHP family)|nr:histidinol-phosphatase HisJ family protein [Lachnospiraceae bacterium]
MLADYHIHTIYSDDSDYPMEAVVTDAIAMGLQEICFTDHVDYGIKRDRDDPRGVEYRSGGAGEPEQIALANVDYPRYAAEIKALREKYRGQIAIRMGLEFGIQTHTIPEYEKLFARYPFDFIILSVHQVEDKEFWTWDFQRGRSQEEYVGRYYEELFALVRQFHDYSVLGHLDLIARYDPAGPYPFKKLRPVLTEILKTVIADGKGIEVNTSCHRYGLGDMTPARDILRLYRELGGTIVTIGSDSHKKEHLGAYIREAKEELKGLGFEQYCTYERMEPIYHRL